MQNLTLDELDRKIIMILLEDARASYVDLAHRLGIAESTAYNRLNKLVNADVIQNFTAIVDLKKLGLTCASFLLEVEHGKTPKVINALKNMKNIVSIIELADKYNLMAFGVFCNIEDYGKFLDRKIIPLDGIRDVKASVGLSLYRPPPIKPSLVEERCPGHDEEDLSEEIFPTPSAPVSIPESKVIPIVCHIPFSFVVIP